MFPSQLRIDDQEQAKEGKLTIIAQRPRILRGLITCVFLLLFAAAIAAANSETSGQRLAMLEVNLIIGAAVCCVTNFVASILYLVYHRLEADALALAAGQVGFVFFITLVIVGTLWFHYQFAVWWGWDKALTFAVFVVPVYLSYLLLRHYAYPGQAPVLAAVLAIFAFLDLPLAMLAVSLRTPRTASPRQLPGPYLLTGETFLRITMLAAAATWLAYEREVKRQREMMIENPLSRL